MTKRHVRLTTHVARPYVEPIPNTTANNECDSNADTCCLGKNLWCLRMHTAPQTFMHKIRLYNQSSMFPSSPQQLHMTTQCQEIRSFLFSMYPYTMVPSLIIPSLTPIMCELLVKPLGIIPSIQLIRCPRRLTIDCTFHCDPSVPSCPFALVFQRLMN
jgi:hypothetical protein